MEELKIPAEGCTYIFVLDDSHNVLKVIMEYEEPKPFSTFLNWSQLWRPALAPRRVSPPMEQKASVEGIEARKCPNCGAMMVKEGCCGGQQRWRCTRCNYRSL